MKTTKIKVLFILLIFEVFSSCKKEKETYPEQTPNAITPAESTPSRIDGYVSFFLYFSFKQDSTRFQHGQLLGSFYNKAKHIDSLPRYLISDDVGDIVLNGTTLQRLNNTLGLMYNYVPSNASESQQFLKERSWHLKGNDKLIETKFIDKIALPEYISNVALPDTIYKYKNTVIKFGRLSGMDSAIVSIILADPYGNSGVKFLTQSNHELTFSKEDFYTITPQNQFSFAEIEISIFKPAYQVVDGKAFRYGYNVTYRSEQIPFAAY